VADYRNQVAWEFDRRLPVWCHGCDQPPSISSNEAAAIQSIVDDYGLVLLRGFNLSGEQFLRWVSDVCGDGWGSTRLAPDATALAGPRIELHSEGAMLPFMPAWLWFYAAKTAERGGETVLCDGEAILSGLSDAALSFLADDIVYWWRSSTLEQPGKTPVVNDPPGIDRWYRGLNVEQAETHLEITALTRPIIRSRIGGRRVFANHILNTIAHDDDGGPPKLNGFHRVRTLEGKPLPDSLIRELRDVTSSLRFSVLLHEKEMLWLDNTRFLHGREAFEGSRYIIVHKGYHPSQLLFGHDSSHEVARCSGTE
jgi:alpha-ketoglutarate-dependent taurine dioxygenase